MLASFGLHVRHPLQPVQFIVDLFDECIERARWDLPFRGQVTDGLSLNMQQVSEGFTCLLLAQIRVILVGTF